MDELKLGEIYATNGICREAEETYGFRDFCTRCLLRHRSGDWGDLCNEDKLSNDEAIKAGDRIMSAYRIPKRFCIGYEDKIWIITEADRTVTTILFPYEY